MWIVFEQSAYMFLVQRHATIRGHQQQRRTTVLSGSMRRAGTADGAVSGGIEQTTSRRQRRPCHEWVGILGSAVCEKRRGVDWIAKSTADAADRCGIVGARTLRGDRT